MISGIKSLEYRLKRGFKNIYQEVLSKIHKSKTIVFIVGCQRSGTTMLNEVFERDMRLKVYSEFSKLSSTHTPRLRLNPYPMVRKQIDRNHAGVIVLKPLVETQNIDRLLEYFPESIAIWPFRHYKDVASSNIKKFGTSNGIDDLRPIFEGLKDNWRAERISPETELLVKKYFSETMPAIDAAALFWYARNILLFERGMESNPRVHLVRYRDLVSSPMEELKAIYDLIGVAHPPEKIFAKVHNASVGKGKSVALSPEIEQHCDQLWNRMLAATETQKRSR